MLLRCLILLLLFIFQISREFTETREEMESLNNRLVELEKENENMKKIVRKNN